MRGTLAFDLAHHRRPPAPARPISVGGRKKS
jgi:hypothetical protein